jgi:Raf kinase inhibitor-like YbhB/YbcL family protein
MLSEKPVRIIWLRTFTIWGPVVALWLLVFHGPGMMKVAHSREAKGGAPMNFAIASSAFSHNESIPAIHTCDGKDISPPLAWSNLPAGTRSLALIVDDPDAPDPRAPKMTWVHWVIYNIPAESTGLPEDGGSGDLPVGTMEGRNNWGRTGYGGPCPPIGRHRYFFKLYALDSVLPDLEQPGKDQLLKAMEGHILDKAELIGTYQR